MSMRRHPNPILLWATLIVAWTVLGVTACSREESQTPRPAQTAPSRERTGGEPAGPSESSEEIPISIPASLADEVGGARFLQLTHRQLEAVPGTTPHAIGEVAAVGTAEGRLLGFSLDSGEPRWVAPFKGPVTSLAPDRRGFVAAADRVVALVDPGSGSRIWSTELPAAITTSFRVTTTGVYFGLADGSLVAVDLDSGALRWRSVTDNASPFLGDLAILDGIVYGVQAAGMMAAVRANSGEELWRVTLPAVTATGPVLYGESVLAVSVDGAIVGVNRTTGELALQGSAEGVFVSSPVVQGDALVLTSAEGRVSAFDLAAAVDRGSAGSPVWSVSLPADHAGRTVATSTSVVAGDVAGRLFALDLRDGATLSTLALPGRPASGGAFFEGTLLIALGDGAVAQIQMGEEISDLPVFTARGRWTLPPEGSFLLEDRSVQIQIPSDADRLVEWRVSSRPDEELVLTVLSPQGSVISTNMGKVALSDSVQVSLDEGMVYVLKIERTSPEGSVELSVIEREVE